jgi:hypothetical protein
MARGTSLERLLNGLRVEARLSLNVEHNALDAQSQVAHLQRVQEWLWDDYDWPHLRVERLIGLQAGQRFYAMPIDLAADRIGHIEAFCDGLWVQLTPGIGSDHYSVTNSELGEREWPPRRWRLADDGGIEIWPISDRNVDVTTAEGQLKIIGIRTLQPLVDPSDVADLDDRLLTLFCAAERLAASGAKDAKLKQDQALKRYASLKAELSPIRRVGLFGSRRPMRDRYGNLVLGSPILGNTSGGPADGGVGSDLLVRVDGGRRG